MDENSARNNGFYFHHKKYSNYNTSISEPCYITFNDERISTTKINKFGVVGVVHGQSGLVRNKGIEMVDTEWIGFLDDDDTIHPDYVKTLSEKYLDYDFSGDLFGPDGSSGAVLIEVKAKEYWSYGDTYNTTTGKPL